MLPVLSWVCRMQIAVVDVGGSDVLQLKQSNTMPILIRIKISNLDGVTTPVLSCDNLRAGSAASVCPRAYVVSVPHRSAGKSA